MDSAQTELLADELIKKVKWHLISTIGRTVEEATSNEFYRALMLCYSRRNHDQLDGNGADYCPA